MKKIILLIIFPAALCLGQNFQLERLLITGANPVDTGIIRRELRIKEGNSYSESSLERERAWMLSRRLGKRIDMQIFPGTADSSRILLLVVEETARWSVVPLVNINGLFGLYGGVEVGVRNAAGSGSRLAAFFQTGGITEAGLRWDNPWMVLGTRLFCSIEFSHLSLPYRYGDHPTDFPLREQALMFSAGPRFGRLFRLGLILAGARVYCGDPGASFSGRQRETTWTAGYVLHYDSRDWPLYPTSGALVQAEMTWTGPDRVRVLRRSLIETRFYVSVLNKDIIAWQARLILSGGTVPVYMRLHQGGGDSMRGYPYGSMAGDNSVFLSLEYRFPLALAPRPLYGLNAGLAGVIFLDTGTAWFGGDKFTRSSFHSSAGLGLHLIWDGLVLRAEYGYHGRGWGFLSVGTSVKF